VLVVAGGFKRDDHDLGEHQLLLRALRDFNKPKIVAEDLDIFFKLLDDLFPEVHVEAKRELRRSHHTELRRSPSVA
jgi:dynein heavy chain